MRRSGILKFYNDLRKLKVKSFGNYVGRSYEQIWRWRNVTVLKFLMQMQPTEQKFIMTKFDLCFVGIILVLSASREMLFK